MFKKIAVTVASLLALFLLGYLFTTSMVKPISSDLSVIGQGKPVLALAYENFSPTGGDALTRLREVQAEYESQVQFVVADLGTPPGKDLARKHRLRDGQAVFLDGAGAKVGAFTIPVDLQTLRSRLDQGLERAE